MLILRNVNKVFKIYYRQQKNVYKFQKNWNNLIITRFKKLKKNLNFFKLCELLSQICNAIRENILFFIEFVEKQ